MENIIDDASIQYIIDNKHRYVPTNEDVEIIIILRDDHYTVILNLKKENGEEIDYFNPYFDSDRLAKDLPIIRDVSLANDGTWT